MASFATLLRDNIAAQGDYRVMPIECPDHPCTATSMTPDAFVAAARRAGARLVVYGGIRKMSTLVQWGEVQLLDLENEKLLLRRTVTFRGDNDMAYRRARRFCRRYAQGRDAEALSLEGVTSARSRSLPATLNIRIGISR